MSKRNTKDKPLTKGLALIQAREILGPSASVQRTPTECKILAGNTIIYASTWETALEQAEKEPLAKAWQDFKDTRKLSLIDAMASLKDKAISILKGKEGKLLTKSEHHFIRNSLRGLA